MSTEDEETELKVNVGRMGPCPRALLEPNGDEVWSKHYVSCSHFSVYDAAMTRRLKSKHGSSPATMVELSGEWLFGGGTQKAENTIASTATRQCEKGTLGS